MKILQYHDARSFHADTAGALGAREAENNLPLGILHRGAEEGATDGWFMARVLDDAGGDALTALMTPPRNLMLAGFGEAVSKPALWLLSEHILSLGISLPGAVAEEELALAFAGVWARLTGKAFEIPMRECLYRLERVEAVPRIGALRAASPRDMHFLPYWLKGFADDCFHTNAPLDVESARWNIERGTLDILEVEGLPVAMAGSTRQLPHGRSVGPVYTPPYYRARGYATACVAMLSRRILEAGNAYCALFADSANPVSNGIYQKIGYKPVCNFAEIRFF